MREEPTLEGQEVAQHSAVGVLALGEQSLLGPVCTHG